MNEVNIKKIPVVIFTGKCRYAQIYPGQERGPHPDKIKQDPSTAGNRSFMIDVECSQDLFDSLIKAGMSTLKSLKEVEGVTYIRVEGTERRLNKVTGEMMIFQPPIVIDGATNEPLDINTLIGNGSIVAVTAELADTKPVRALRLKRVTVLKLVPYVKQEVKEEVLFSSGDIDISKYDTAAVE